MPTEREIERKARKLRQLRGMDIDKHELPLQSIAHVLSNYPVEDVPGRDDLVLIDGELHRAFDDWIKEEADR